VYHGEQQRHLGVNTLTINISLSNLDFSQFHSLLFNFAVPLVHCPSTCANQYITVTFIFVGINLLWEDNNQLAIDGFGV
jgi:hypothetical protein